MLDALFAQATDGIAIIDTQGFFVKQNEAHRRLIGYEDAELVGQTPAVHLGEETFAHVANALQASGQFRGIVESNTKAGPRHLELVAFSVKDDGGQVRFHVGMARDVTRDITGRKAAEEQLHVLNAELEDRVHRRTQELERAVREREAFSYSVSHDLRTPLRTIRGFTSILLEDYGTQLDARGKQYLDFVHGATRRMSDIIDDLLKLSRVTRAELHRRDVNLSAVATMIVKRLHEGEPERVVETNIEEGLRANADLQLVQVVLENLLENAWKFTRHAEPPRIEFGVRASAGVPEFFVRDNGAGFDMAYADKLFQPFQRLHSTREFEGTGIGLATVARIVERHGGRVRAEGAVNGGATISFSL